jgi:hypothetical protein
MTKINVEEFSNKKVRVWFLIDNLRVHNAHTSIIEDTNQFICYYNFKEPTIMLFGELIRDNKNQIKTFKSETEALDAAIDFVMKKHGISR